MGFFLITNCNTYHESQQVRLSDQISLNFEKKMQEEYGLYLFHHHPSISPKTNKIHRLNVEFSMVKNANIEDARNLIIPCIEKFLYQINNDLQIRSFLNHYPFTVSDVIIGIGFFDKDGNHYHDESVAYVSVVNGKIYFRKVIPPKDFFKDMYCETFEEAQKIVNSQR